MREASPRRPRGDAVARDVRTYLAALVVTAGVVALMVALGTGDVADPSVAAVVAVWIAFMATNLVSVRVGNGPVSESATFVEIGAVPAMLLLSPREAIVVALVAALITEWIRSPEVPKIAFNTSWLVIGVGAGAAVYRTIAGDGPFQGELIPIVGALVAGAVLVLTNLVALSRLRTVVSGVPWRDTLVEATPSALRDGYGAAIIGVLVTVLLLAAPVAIPLVVVLALMLRRRMESRADGFERLAAERDRFERTVGGSSDGVVLLGADDTVEVWNPAMAAISGIDESAALGATLDDLGWSQLGGEGTGAELTLELAGRVLAVRRATAAGDRPRTTVTVITVRDVSREAELARIREDLVSRVSHELRTPLTSLEGFLEVLTDRWDDLGDDGRRELLVASRRGARRLSRHVGNLMLWTGIESRSGRHARADAPPVAPVAVLRDVLSEVPLDDVRLHVDGSTEVAASVDDVHTILANLLSNAALYGAPPVSVAIERRGDEVALAVTDAGPGLPDEFRALLYEPFAQASDGLQRTARGLGMGLAIVQAVARSNGGDVRHEDAPGGGARFTVTLPAALPPAGTVEHGVDYDASGASSSNR